MNFKRLHYFSVCLCIAATFAVSSFAQTGIASLTVTNTNATLGTTYSSTGAGNTTFPEYGTGINFTYRYGVNSTLTPGKRAVASFATATASYVPKSLVVTVKMRRVDNAVVTGNKSILFYRGSRTGTSPNYTLNLNSEYNTDMEAAFAANNLFSGTDNIFTNSGDVNGNNNNIERLDVIVPAGLSVGKASTSGFPVFERGVYGGHDGYKVAVITSLDGSGVPNGYSNVLNISSATYNNAAATNPVANDQYYVLRNSGSGNLLVSADANQGMGGVLSLFSDFGIADGTIIYGFSLMGTDFAGTTGASVINYNNATNYPTTSGTAGGIDLIAAMFFVDAVVINGNVYNDANGLKDTIVNGTGTNAGGINAVLYNNTTGQVAALTAVAANGTYSLNATPGNAYTIYLTTSAVTIGQTAVPAISLPAGWVNTGEYLGTGAGNDGTVNSILPVGTVNAPVDNANFGIEQRPNSQSSSTSISSPLKNSLITLNGGSNPPFFTGSDPEDQVATGTLSGKTVSITSLPANGELWYNGSKITFGQDGTTSPSVTNPFAIPNFSPSLMQVKFTGSGYSSVSFGYSYIDAAGFIDLSPATYSLNWSIPLPVKIESFTGRSLTDCTIMLNWKTTNEQSVSEFGIMYSADGKYFTNLGVVKSLHEASMNDYSFTGKQDAGKGYYQLQITDLDGSTALSNMVIVQTTCNAAHNIIIAPTPSKGMINITGLNPGQEVQVYDMKGQRIAGFKAVSSFTQLDLSNYANGIYQIMVIDGNERLATLKVIKD